MDKGNDIEMSLELPFEDPTLDPEERQKQLSNLAMLAIEQRIRSGKASGQELLYFARIGSKKSQLEDELLETRCRELESKIRVLEDQSSQAQIFEQALQAFKGYHRAFDDDGGYYGY